MYKKFRVYGKEGHRQRESFGKSYIVTGDNWTMLVAREDVTETNDYVDISIYAESEQRCDEIFEGQLSDGVFENSRYGRIGVIANGSQI